jgi:PAS domain S-box-containing protein
MDLGPKRAFPVNDASFKHFFENAAIGMAMVSPEGNFLGVNSFFCRVFGYNEDQLVGKSFQDITYPEDHHIGAEFVKSALLGNDSEVSQLEKRYIRANGEVFWAKVTAYLAREDDGKPLYFVSQIADISETKALVNQLHEKAWQLDKAQEMSKVGHWRLDAAAMEVTGSDELFRIFGVDRDDASLDTFAAAVHPDDLEYNLKRSRTRPNLGH